MTSLAQPGYSYPALRAGTHAVAQRRLSEAFRAALRVPFDDATPVVVMSDSHRGNGGKLDAFAPNRALFLAALGYYFESGFIYIEAGDGDELWKGWRFADIYRAHTAVFDLFQRFAQAGRLHLLFGNHEALGKGRYQTDKGGLTAREGVVLEHQRTGARLFVVHGHQVEPHNDSRVHWSRLVVRHVWARLQAAGVASLGGRPYPPPHATQCRISQRIRRWAADHRQMVVCGHTHRPAVARPGAAPYFNAGACMYLGQITGLEIVGGYIQLVRWLGRPWDDDALPRREPLTPPLPLAAYQA
ncbi:MAG: metallophosphoesterase family protein [Caldilineales bacterium]|nr:metallophosphoesterase family protein [Caldilineales bacterium]MDW8319449.1 metallophosphoesterase family protein [Anaerolineae bacterium]